MPGRPLVTASLILRNGAADDAPDVAGATSLAARALSEGTERYDAVALVEATERLGAGLHADAGWDASTVSIEVPVARLEPALDLLAEVAAHPTFPVREVERLREERLNDLLQARAEPRRRVDEAFIGTIYKPSSPYHQPSGGLAGTVGTLDADRLAAAWRRGFDPRRMTLILAGDLDGAGGGGPVAMAERLLGGWALARGATAIGGAGQLGIRRQLARHQAPRSAGLGADRDPRRPRRRAPPDRPVRSAERDERDPGRPVQLAPEHEAARGEGLHVRRRRPASIPAAGQVRSRLASRSTPRSPSRPWSSSSPSSTGFARSRSRRRSWRPRATSSSASSRCASRRRDRSSAPSAGSSSTTCPTTS